MKQPVIDVVGAGLAGSEAAWQIAKRGIRVRLIDMKPAARTPAHTSDGFAELVCSNSLRSDQLHNAAGLLKAEMELLDSLVMRCARASAVPAGSALAVDRNRFSSMVTASLQDMPDVVIEERTVASLDEWTNGRPVVIAAGPLCTDALAESIADLAGAQFLSFYDAVAPIVSSDSIDMSQAFWGSRYGCGGDDYINCALSREQYEQFWDNLVHAETAQTHGCDTDAVFEGCMPIETMASRGIDTMRFGPLKPRGIIDPRTGKEPYAVVQLRKEDADGRQLNMVGFQTRLRFGEQKRVFRMIPALHDADFQRLGVMHRNTFLRSPASLDKDFRLKSHPWIRFAGQITGVEGYIESAATGLLAGIGAAMEFQGSAVPSFGTCTALGALGAHVSNQYTADYQPSNISFGMIDPLDHRVRGKQRRNLELAHRALDAVRAISNAAGL